MSGKRDNPSISVNPVTVEACNIRHQSLDSKIEEILSILKGNSKDINDAGGLVGSFRDLKRDRKWIYIIITVLGIPLTLLIVNFLMKGG